MVHDDEAQAARARALLSRGPAEGATFFVSAVVLVELAWVLRSRYGASRAEIADTIDQLLLVEEVQVDGADAARRATACMRSGGASFPDHFLVELARDAGCTEVATFDRALHDHPLCQSP